MAGSLWCLSECQFVQFPSIQILWTRNLPWPYLLNATRFNECKHGTLHLVTLSREQTNHYVTLWGYSASTLVGNYSGQRIQLIMPCMACREPVFILEDKDMGPVYGILLQAAYSSVLALCCIQQGVYDRNMHTGAFLTGFYCHFDHPEQYQTMLLPVKNSRLILTCKCTLLHVRFDSVWQCLTVKCALDIPWEIYQHFEWFWPLQS